MVQGVGAPEGAAHDSADEIRQGQLLARAPFRRRRKDRAHTVLRRGRVKGRVWREEWRESEERCQELLRAITN